MVTKAPKVEQDKKGMVRARASYHNWQQWAEFLAGYPTPEEIMHRVQQELDRRSAFGSVMASSYSMESLRQLLDDRRADIKSRCVREMGAEFVLGHLDDDQWGTLHLNDDVAEFCYERCFADVKDVPAEEYDQLEVKPVQQEVRKIMASLRKLAGKEEENEEED